MSQHSNDDPGKTVVTAKSGTSGWLAGLTAIVLVLIAAYFVFYNDPAGDTQNVNVESQSTQPAGTSGDQGGSTTVEQTQSGTEGGATSQDSTNTTGTTGGSGSTQ